VIAEFAGIEIVFADAGAHGGNERADFLVTQHAVVARFFDVEDFPFERQDGLEAAVAALGGCAAGGFAFDQEEFAAGGVAFLAIAELAGQATGIERAFAAGEVAGFAGGFASAGSPSNI